MNNFLNSAFRETVKVTTVNNEYIDHILNDFDPIKSLGELHSLLESLPPWAYWHHALYRKLTAATEGIDSEDSDKAKFDLMVVGYYLGRPFDSETSPWKTSDIKESWSHIFTSLQDINWDWKPYLLGRFLETNNPVLKARLGLVNLFAADARSRDNMRATYGAMITSSQVLLRFAGHHDGLLEATTHLKFSAYIFSKFSKALEGPDDLYATLGWCIAHCGKFNELARCIGNIVLHFAHHQGLPEDWRPSKKLVRATKHLLQASAGYEAELDNFYWFPQLAQLAIQLAEAEGDDAGAKKIREHFETRAIEVAEKYPGPIGHGIVEGVIARNPYGIGAISPDTLIKAVRCHNREIAKHFKPIAIGRLTIPKESILDDLPNDAPMIDYLAQMSAYASVFFLSDEWIKNQTRQPNWHSPLLMMFRNVSMQGDRPSSTSVGADYHENRARLSHLVEMMMTVAVPALRTLNQRFDDPVEAIMEVFRHSRSWDAKFTKQLRSGLKHLFAEETIDACYLLCAFLEGHLRRVLDKDGIEVDKLKDDGIIHGTLMTPLLNALPRVGWSSAIVATMKAALVNVPAGWNLRNDQYHGLAPDDDFSVGKACALFVFLVMLLCYDISRSDTSVNN